MSWRLQRCKGLPPTGARKSCTKYCGENHHLIAHQGGSTKKCGVHNTENGLCGTNPFNEHSAAGWSWNGTWLGGGAAWGGARRRQRRWPRAPRPPPRCTVPPDAPRAAGGGRARPRAGGRAACGRGIPVARTVGRALGDGRAAGCRVAGPRRLLAPEATAPVCVRAREPGRGTGWHGSMAPSAAAGTRRRGHRSPSFSLRTADGAGGRQDRGNRGAGPRASTRAARPARWAVPARPDAPVTQWGACD